MYATTIWKYFVTRFPWYFKKMCCSQEASMTIFAGVMNMPVRKKFGGSVSWPWQMDSSDTITDALIRKAFREEIPNTTKIIIAQRVSSIEDADQIIVLDDGKIAGVGTSEELLKTNDIYREVYE